MAGGCSGGLRSVQRGKSAEVGPPPGKFIILCCGVGISPDDE